MVKHITVGVSDLRQRLGERKTIAIDVLLPELEVIASRSVPDEPVAGEVVIESMERGVSVRGEVSYRWVGDCRRCLDEVTGKSDVTIDEHYQVGAPSDSDIIELEGDQIDLLPLVRDAVLVGLPLAPLCRPDCTGPDPDRYPALTEDELEQQRATEADADDPPGDPRWAALDQLRGNDD